MAAGRRSQGHPREPRSAPQAVCGFHRRRKPVLRRHRRQGLRGSRARRQESCRRVGRAEEVQHRRDGRKIQRLFRHAAEARGGLGRCGLLPVLEQRGALPRVGCLGGPPDRPREHRQQPDSRAPARVPSRRGEAVRLRDRGLPVGESGGLRDDVLKGGLLLSGFFALHPRQLVRCVGWCGHQLVAEGHPALVSRRGGRLLQRAGRRRVLEAGRWISGRRLPRPTLAEGQGGRGRAEGGGQPSAAGAVHTRRVSARPGAWLVAGAVSTRGFWAGSLVESGRVDPGPSRGGYSRLVRRRLLPRSGDPKRTRHRDPADLCERDLRGHLRRDRQHTRAHGSAEFLPHRRRRW